MSKVPPSFKSTKRFFTTAVLSISSLLGTIACTLQPSQAEIIGQDDRVTPPFEGMIQSPFSAVGQLVTESANGQFSTCTFTVIGRNIGITNTHCVLDEQGRVPRKIGAALVQHGNRVLAIASVDTFWTGMDTFPKNVGEYIHDWAIVRFTSNLGDRTGWFGNVNWNRNTINAAGQSVVNQTANYIGYPNDWPTNVSTQPGDLRGQTPALHAGCKILDVQVGLLLHDCDTAPGTSGASLVTAFSDTDIRTIGLNNASLRIQNGAAINLAVPLERFMPAVEALRATGAASNTSVPRP